MALWYNSMSFIIIGPPGPRIPCTFHDSGVKLKGQEKRKPLLLKRKGELFFLFSLGEKIIWKTLKLAERLTLYSLACYEWKPFVLMQNFNQWLCWAAQKTSCLLNVKYTVSLCVLLDALLWQLWPLTQRFLWLFEELINWSRYVGWSSILCFTWSTLYFIIQSLSVEVNKLRTSVWDDKEAVHTPFQWTNCVRIFC